MPRWLLEAEDTSQAGCSPAYVQPVDQLGVGNSVYLFAQGSWLGLGELGISGAGAAVANATANAIFNATCVGIREYPLCLDKVLAGIDA